MPECYILPQERDSLLQAFDSSRGRPWIIKPAGSSQGRGIYIITNPLELPDTYQNSKSDDNWIAERYVDNPLLVNNRKFDLRLYVAVTSFNPLKIYLHKEGLCRLATEPYSNDTYDHKYAHLTNYSINKHNIKNKVVNPEDGDLIDEKQTNMNKDRNNDGELKGNELKLSLAELNTILEDMGISSGPIWNKIEDLIIKTLISVESKIYNALEMFSVNNESCFELFGFDVLIDAALKPWLMEVNFSPSLNTDSPLDLKVKGKVLADLFNLVGVKQSGNASTNKNKESFTNPFADIATNEILSELKASFDIDLQGDKGKRSLITFIKEIERANSGGYKLIFPVTVQEPGQHISTILRYNNFFEDERPLNKLLAQYIFANSLLNHNRNKSINTPEKEAKRSLTATRLKEHLSNSKDFNSLWARAAGHKVVR
jgi:tubulin polyglutamylase TTLL5